LYQGYQLENTESVVSGLITNREVVFRLIDTDGYICCIWIDTDLRELVGARPLLHHEFCPSFKYLRFKHSYCKDIGIRIFEFEAKAQFLQYDKLIARLPNVVCRLYILENDKAVG